MKTNHNEIPRPSSGEKQSRSRLCLVAEVAG